ncbi:sensor histidine kinase [Amnibacterium kyonggiense]|uniref:Sensor-like histidine kinase SenX3 n=1 Tax=Amnibacterium kyonggiense TaxID=595671 RepID=A0A4R7FRE6_9MICO|nr:ATP-binding protein [Amnibacterium kyonggiense]TDS80392.1 two-component system sensor histidine kinase SenX3 [Amnibacterium kyonggiense]
MSAASIVVLGIVFGLAVGVVFTLLIRAAVDRGAAVLDLQADALPDGAIAVLSALTQPALVVDGSNAVVQATPEALAMGLTDGRALAHPEVRRVIDAARTTGDAARADLLLPRTAAGPRTLVVTAHAAPIDVSRVLLIVDDRSESVRLDAMRRDFVANTSHELKTPIGAVSLLAEAVDSAADDPDQVRRFAARLSTEAARLGALVQQIIEFSRVQGADPLDAAEAVSLDDVLRTAVDRTRVAAEARGVTVVVGKRAHLWTLGDQAMLVTAVQNLVANAIAFSPQKGHVGVGLRKRDGVVEIAVSDQGIGIAEEDLGRVFERFYRTDQARSRQTGGTGLGLSIVKHIAENHGGEARAWSRLGRGSTFTIRLPEIPAPTTARTPRREKERA